MVLLTVDFYYSREVYRKKGIFVVMETREFLLPWKLDQCSKPQLLMAHQSSVQALKIIQNTWLLLLFLIKVNEWMGFFWLKIVRMFSIGSKNIVIRHSHFSNCSTTRFKLLHHQFQTAPPPIHPDLNIDSGSERERTAAYIFTYLALHCHPLLLLQL